MSISPDLHQNATLNSTHFQGGYDVPVVSSGYFTVMIAQDLVPALRKLEGYTMEFQ
jgi:hypothetical protein